MNQFTALSGLSSPTIRIIGACNLYGITFDGDYLYAIDTTNGHLFQINLSTGYTTIVNTEAWSEFIGVTGIAIAQGELWFTRDEDIYVCPFDPDHFEFKPELFARTPRTADGIAITDNTVYVTSQRSGYIHIFNKTQKAEITHLYAPGIGVENITVRGEEIWVSDRTEQTVFCLDRATGETIFSVLTPFESPTGLAFYPDPETGKELLYVAYADSEVYIRDNPNAEPNYEIQYRDRTFIHPLYFHFNPQDKYALSNGYLVELSYVEELAPLDVVELEDLEWRIALPAETDRQRIRSIEPVGLPFTEEVQEGQRVAVFKFDHLNQNQRYIFGWKAIVELWSIKYQLTPPDCETLPNHSEEFTAKYLVDNDNLAMESEIIVKAAKESIQNETNLLRQMYSIRNYVYDRLSYGIKPHIDPPDIALRRGVGSCGEYLGVLLALSRLNGIASRTVGRYKCPLKPDLRYISLVPDFNHVWMEFYVPGFGWVPMETNTDDVREGGPYPTRFFMGLSWYHTEMAKGIPFEVIRKDGVKIPKEEVSIGELAINHVQFVILEELDPSAVRS
ncbi:MAG: transglutaminase [Synechococcaceae cyanobacterium RL_1_2]|nr:transglutaminase [Synechococcaceae cyanobacterium RL_1_2]